MSLMATINRNCNATIAATHLAVASLLFVGLAAGCSDAGSSQDFSGLPVVELHADYPSFDAAALDRDSRVIFEGIALESRGALRYPTFAGDTPEENPLLGLDEREYALAMASLTPIPITETTFRVTAAYRGDLATGDEVVITQTGGVLEGVRYVLQSDPPFSIGESYLLFGANSVGDAYYVLGGSAGMYREVDDRVFEPVDATNSPLGWRVAADEVSRRFAG